MGNLLFSISLFHQYYDNGRFQNFSIVANEQTQNTLDRYQLIAKLEQGVYSIYYFGNEKFSEFSASIPQIFNQQPLAFHIRTDIQQFSLISDLPLNRLGVFKYSSGNIENSSPRKTLLLPSLVDGSVAMQGEVGEISIAPEDLFDSQGERVITNFDIRIDARKTQWNYYVFNPSKIKLVAPKILSRGGIVLDPPTRTTVGSDDDVLLFSSGERRFVLAETPKHSFDLLSNSESVPSVTRRLLKGLPSPSTNEISIKSDSGRDYACSQMYVYL
ncbi:MAG: hypothetical protein ACI9XU_000587 [Arenicella sp.]|jgi:hypothetical protein